MTLTGLDAVSAALRKIGVLGSGDTADASDATDGLSECNRMLGSWSNDGLLIPAITSESPLTLTPGVATVTLGALGNITTRPQKIVAALLRDGTLDNPMRILTPEEYAAITAKTVQTTIPYALYDDGGYPQRTITLYPVPSAAKQLVLFTQRPLTEIATLSTQIILPPGYDDTIIYNLADRLAGEYGKQLSPKDMARASALLQQLRRANHRPMLARCDEAIAGQGRRMNIFSGGFNQ